MEPLLTYSAFISFYPRSEVKRKKEGSSEIPPCIFGGHLLLAWERNSIRSETLTTTEGIVEMTACLLLLLLSDNTLF